MSPAVPVPGQRRGPRSDSPLPSTHPIDIIATAGTTLSCLDPGAPPKACLSEASGIVLWPVVKLFWATYSHATGDCSPRLPTVHLQTSKPGPNHGRWCTLLSLSLRFFGVKSYQSALVTSPRGSNVSSSYGTTMPLQERTALLPTWRPLLHQPASEHVLSVAA